MTIKTLEVLACRDWDPRRGYSLWLIVRFPAQIGKSHHAPAWACLQMAEKTWEAFVERHGYEPLLIQNIQRSAWWRAGPAIEEAIVE